MNAQDAKMALIPAQSPRRDKPDGGFPAVAGRHTVGVESISSGLDWESGKVLIVPDEPLHAGMEHLESASRFANRIRDIMYIRQCDDSRMRNGNALRLIAEALDKWMPDRSERVTDE